MSNAVFPTFAGLSWSPKKTPKFKTLIQEAVSLTELRASLTPYPVYTFELSYDVLREATAYQELQNLMGFFRLRQGSFDSFLYTDPSDYTVTLQSFGSGNGSTTAFQLVRAHGGFTEPVMNLNGLPNIYVNGTLKTLTTDYTISPTGVITFNTPPANGLPLTWTGSYYYRVRFLEDSNEFENFMYRLWSLKKLQLYGSTGNKV